MFTQCDMVENLLMIYELTREKMKRKKEETDRKKDTILYSIADKAYKMTLHRCCMLGPKISFKKRRKTFE